jgi:hypothetical protein
MLYNYITSFFNILFAIHIHTCDDYEERQCIKVAFSVVLAREKTKNLSTPEEQQKHIGISIVHMFFVPHSHPRHHERRCNIISINGT